MGTQGISDEALPTSAGCLSARPPRKTRTPVCPDRTDGSAECLKSEEDIGTTSLRASLEKACGQQHGRCLRMAKKARTHISQMNEDRQHER